MLAVAGFLDGATGALRCLRRGLEALAGRVDGANQNVPHVGGQAPKALPAGQAPGGVGDAGLEADAGRLALGAGRFLGVHR